MAIWNGISALMGYLSGLILCVLNERMFLFNKKMELVGLRYNITIIFAALGPVVQWIE